MKKNSWLLILSWSILVFGQKRNTVPFRPSVHRVWHVTYGVHATRCSYTFIVVCDAWWLWKCSWKREVFTDFLICIISSLIEECDECACLRLMSHSSDQRWAGELNMPLGAAKNFLIDSKATFSNSQKMSLLNSWLAQGGQMGGLGGLLRWYNCIRMSFLFKKVLGAEKNLIYYTRCSLAVVTRDSTISVQFKTIRDAWREHSVEMVQYPNAWDMQCPHACTRMGCPHPQDRILDHCSSYCLV